ncbi:hypothetical protein KCU67_g1196, partial [Aureobasidium melanogenum]
MSRIQDLSEACQDAFRFTGDANDPYPAIEMVIKELIENAIDSGSPKVHVQERENSLKNFRVTDWGRGIHRSSLELAAARYASSHVVSPDLHDLSTYGFRGSALYRLTDISTLRVASNPDKELDHGRYVDFPKGKSGAARPLMPHARGQGTMVEVANVFGDNKEMRESITANIAECQNVVRNVGRAYALFNRHVAFYYELQGAPHPLVFKTDGKKGIEATFKAIWPGFDYRKLTNVVYFNFTIEVPEQGSSLVRIPAEGFITNPGYKSPRSASISMINSHWARLDGMTQAILAAHGNTGTAPFLVYNIRVPKSKFEYINASKEVRFMSAGFEDAVKNMLTRGVTGAINGDTSTILRASQRGGDIVQPRRSSSNSWFPPGQAPSPTIPSSPPLNTERRRQAFNEGQELSLPIRDSGSQRQSARTSGYSMMSTAERRIAAAEGQQVDHPMSGTSSRRESTRTSGHSSRGLPTLPSQQTGQHSSYGSFDPSSDAGIQGDRPQRSSFDPTSDVGYQQQSQRK